MEEILNDDCGGHKDITDKVSGVMPDGAVLYDNDSVGNISSAPYTQTGKAR